MKKPKLILWIFLPTKQDLEKHWDVPANYIRATMGEFRGRLETDTPLSDTRFFERGWKRMSDIEKEYDCE